MKTQLVLSLFCLFIVHGAFGGQKEFVPQGFCPLVVDYDHFSLCYVSEHRQASWVKYKLTFEQIDGPAKRKNNYRMDPRIEDPVMGSDYSGSGFDRGHLLPAADMKKDANSMSQTFYMTNMSPQRPNFNRRIWAQIEMRVRNLVRQHGEGHVITGGVLEVGLPRIATGVSIPDLFYKVIYFPGPQIAKAFLIENRAYDGFFFSDFLVTVDEVEAITGFDFFSELPDPLESHVESTLFRE